jgi:hypothetical protein
MKPFVILSLATLVAGGCSLTRSAPATTPPAAQASWRVVRLDPGERQQPAAILINQATGETWSYVPGGTAWEKLKR